MSDNRQKLLHKIKALLSKTVENGCTEAEAMNALSMAQAMMDAYEVTAEDLADTEKESATVQQAKDMKDPHNIRNALAMAVAKFTNTEAWTSDGKKKFNFCGLVSDVEFATWLIETLATFAKLELKNYIWANDYTSLAPNFKRQVINGFVIGCTSRISARLNELAAKSEANHTANGTALIVIKDQLINHKMQELGLKLRTPRRRGSRFNPDAYGAGKEAGNRATFGRPVNGQGSVKLIGNG